MKIKSITARPILDSRGEWTVEVVLTLANGAHVMASVPQGKSTGSHEAETVSAAKAVQNIKKFIAPKLKGQDPRKQRGIDELLRILDGTPTKHRLGGNAILAVSIACAKAAALAERKPLWKYFRKLSGVPARKPRLFINVINGGLHAGNNLDFQEYLVIPRAKTFRESVMTGERIYHALGKTLKQSKGRSALNVGDEGGFAPNFKNNLEPFEVLQRVVRSLGFSKKVDFGIDAAASDIRMSHKKLVALYKTSVRKYPFIYLEDPFGEEAFIEFHELRSELPEKLWVAGDDLTTTNVRRMEKAHANQSVNAVIIKPNQIGTVSEAIDAVRMARKYGWAVIVSHRSGETNDSFIADFAVGVGADGFKLGAPARGERIAKYNRLLEIEGE
jgi:enolase